VAVQHTSLEDLYLQITSRAEEPGAGAAVAASQAAVSESAASSNAQEEVKG
jgi:hypothetical protein